jgi:hypothetical protein
MVPALAAPFALARLSNPLPDIATTDINRSRTIEKNINALPAILTADDRIYVGDIPGPHLASVPY